MSILKPILLSSALITTTFGAAVAYPYDAETQQIERLSISDTENPEANTSTCCHPAPGEVWAMMWAMLPVATKSVVLLLSQIPALCATTDPIDQVMKDRETLQKNWGNIVASLLCSTIPVHEVMTANGFDDPRYLMKTIGIEEDTFQGREVGSYEHTDRKEIAAKLAAYAEKSIITAADIAAGRVVNDGEVVVLGYNDMVAHKAALSGKDIHLCVDVHADANGVLVWTNNNLPKGLKKLYFQNTALDVTRIGDYFLSGCEKLTYVDLSSFANVTIIGDWFLYDCTGLTKVDLSRLTKITQIGEHFLFNCSGLTQVDLLRLTKITHIGNYFLSECSGLIEIKVSEGQKDLVEGKIDEDLKNRVLVVD